MITIAERYYNTIATIQYSDAIEENWELFHNGITILQNRLNNSDFSEFTDEERETLEEIFTLI